MMDNLLALPLGSTPHGRPNESIFKLIQGSVSMSDIILMRDKLKSYFYKMFGELTNYYDVTRKKS